MKELIPVHHTTIKNEIVLTADAREVHEFIINLGGKLVIVIKNRHLENTFIFL